MKILLPIVLVGVLVFAVLGCGESQPAKPASTTQQASQNPDEALALTRLTSAELARFKEIMSGALQSDTYLTTTIRQEFWALMDKLGPYSESDLATLKDMMTGPTLTYMRYFFTDALTALETGQPYKSAERQQYEKRLIDLGVMTQYRLNQNESLMQSIAVGQPVTISGETGVMNESIIWQGLGNVAAGQARIDLLFLRP